MRHSDLRFEMHAATYLLAGGGTGGHLTPGLAVAEALRAENPSCRILFVGCGRPIEHRMLEGTGFSQITVPAESLLELRRNPLRFLWRNWQAYRQSRELLSQQNPHAVIGLGGFASAPVVLAAQRRGTPTLLLEQNIIPGRTNRLLSRRALAVCVTFSGSSERFPPRARCFHTGNPVRAAIAALAANPAEGGRAENVLLVLGGSQGAAGLNEAVRSMVRSQPERWRSLQIIHQAGPTHCDLLRATYAELGIEHIVEPFFTNLAEWYRRATLVVSRAGATTLAELACGGCPAVLVPFPRAADDHQRLNAEAFADSGAAVVVLQSTDAVETGRRLGEQLAPLLEDPGRRIQMRDAQHKLARPQAAQDVIQVLQTLTAGRIK